MVLPSITNGLKLRDVTIHQKPKFMFLIILDALKRNYNIHVHNEEQDQIANWYDDVTAVTSTDASGKALLLSYMSRN